MTSDRPDDRHDRAVAADLRALGRPLRDAWPADDVVATVMTRIAAEPAPTPTRGFRARLRERARNWHWVAAGVSGVLLAVLLVPPIRAAVADWFDFAGVIVRESPGTAPSNAPAPPTADGNLTLDEAARQVDFDLAVPDALGRPDGVEVAADRSTVSLSWNTGAEVVRLDTFDGTLEPRFMKLVYGDAKPVDVDGAAGLWFGEPHRVVVLDSEGTASSAPPRLAGATLLWQLTDTTVRLEGPLSRQRALDIAESAG